MDVEGVVERRANDRADTDQLVEPVRRRDRSVEAIVGDRDRSRFGAEVRCIEGGAVGAADESVGAAAGDERVIARKAADIVGARVALQHVVIERAPNVLEIDQRVGRPESVARQTGAEIDIHPRKRRQVVDRIDTRAAIQGVIALATANPVVSVAASYGVVAVTPGQIVIASAADDAVSPRQAVKEIAITVGDQRICEA